MSIKEVVPGLYQVGLGIVNSYILDDGGDLTLIDTGVAGSDEKIMDAVVELGKGPGDVSRILVTHAHGDHTGGLAALKGLTGAPVYMHPADAALVRRGESARPATAAPGLMNKVIYKMMTSRGPMTVTPVETDYPLSDGLELPIAGGLCAVGAPGHCAGQVVFLWPQHGGVLIAADVASNFMGRLGYPPIFEDFDLGVRSLANVAALDFEVAAFGHGDPIRQGAAQQFRAKWGK